MKYAYIDSFHARKPAGSLVTLRRSCYLLDVSVSGYYGWKSRTAEPARTVSLPVHGEDRILAEAKAAIRQYGSVPGIVRLHRLLERNGVVCHIKRLRRICRMNGIFHRLHRKYLHKGKSNSQAAENILGRRFETGSVNRAWAGDITYIPTEEGWLYTSAVLDLGSRECIGWHFSGRMTSRLTAEALRMAYGKERPPAGCIFHSDLGSQYRSREFQQLLEDYGMVPSMSHKGACWDNAPVESFWSILKREALPNHGRFRTRGEAVRAIRRWILFYNSDRPHTTLGNISPLEFKRKLTASV